jgi:hypothetical protein
MVRGRAQEPEHELIHQAPTDPRSAYSSFIER